MPLVLSGTNGVTFPDSSLQAAAASPFGLKNRIINGDMRIDQRNAGASVTPTTDAYTVDRWQVALSSSTTFFSLQQSSIAPTGFTKSLLATSLGANTPSAGQIYVLQQKIEGFNTADLAWGTANAQTVTVSFWVRASVTGTYGIIIGNGGLTRAYPATYTISSANTWEQKTITIAGDTTGTWTTDNTTGVRIHFNLGTGSTNSISSGSGWVTSAATAWSVSGTTNISATNGATFYITGVQLEIGTSATPFERRLYGQELDLCQRYYETYTTAGNSSLYRWYGSTGAEVCTIFPMQVTKRIAPTISGGSITQSNCSGTTFSDITINSYRLQTVVGSAGMCYFLFSTSITMSAEL